MTSIAEQMKLKKAISDIENLYEMVKQLQKENMDLLGRLEALESRPKPGRPPKNKEQLVVN